MAEVELAGVRKSFDAVDVIKGVDLKNMDASDIVI